MDRRKFLKTSAIGVIGLASSAVVAPDAEASEPAAAKARQRLETDKGFVREPAHKVAVIDSADVVVVGGGPAGFAAAVAAARQGCDVIILERGYFLGGLFTGCDVTLLNNMYTPTPSGRVQAVYGLCDELCRKLESAGMLSWPDTPPNVDTEATKYFMERMCVDAGVRILYGAQAADVKMKGDAIDCIFVETHSGRMAIKAKFVVDCTGDGDILFWTGEDFTEYKYDISAMYRVGGLVDVKKGWTTPHAGVRTLHLGSGIKGVDGLDPYVATDAQIRLRQEMWDKVQELRRAPGSEGAFLLSTPSVVGVRVSRVLNSVFNVTTEGAMSGAVYKDAIGFTGADSEMKWNGTKVNRKNRPMWQVPYRSLVPKTVPNLLVAGRCFGYEQALRYDAREVGTCILTGEAAGIAAAQAVTRRVSCRDVDVDLLRSELRKAGAKLD